MKNIAIKTATYIMVLLCSALETVTLVLSGMVKLFAPVIAALGRLALGCSIIAAFFSLLLKSFGAGNVIALVVCIILASVEEILEFLFKQLYEAFHKMRLKFR